MIDFKVPLPFKFEDERGIIQNILFQTVSSVALITSKAGTQRSNHYHKENGHYLYVLNGRVKYSERNLDGSESQTAEFGPGEMFFTGPMKVHLCEFIEDSVLISMNLQPRGPENDINDTVKELF